MVRFIPYTAPILPPAPPCRPEHPTSEELALEFMEFKMSTDPDKIFLPLNPVRAAWEVENDKPCWLAVGYALTRYKEYLKLKKEFPTKMERYHIKPRRDFLIWDVLIKGEVNTAHYGAWYYGRLCFSGKGGFSSPVFKLGTPTGMYPSPRKHDFAGEGEWKWETHMSEILEGLTELVCNPCDDMGKFCNHERNCRKQAHASTSFNLRNPRFLRRGGSFVHRLAQIRDIMNWFGDFDNCVTSVDDEENFPGRVVRKRKLLRDLEECPMQKCMRFMEIGIDCNCADNTPIHSLRHFDDCAYMANTPTV